ncbi:MAG: hypothetical protein ACKO34_02490 [Vampirovibrionales bacterium]
MTSIPMGLTDPHQSASLTVTLKGQKVRLTEVPRGTTAVQKNGVLELKYNNQIIGTIEQPKHFLGIGPIDTNSTKFTIKAYGKEIRSITINPHPNTIPRQLKPGSNNPLFLEFIGNITGGLTDAAGLTQPPSRKKIVPQRPDPDSPKKNNATINNGMLTINHTQGGKNVTAKISVPQNSEIVKEESGILYIKPPTGLVFAVKSTISNNTIKTEISNLYGKTVYTRNPSNKNLPKKEIKSLDETVLNTLNSLNKK